MTTTAPAAANDQVRPDPGEVQPVAPRDADRIITGTITALPFIALGHRRLAGLGRPAALERRRRLPDHVRADRARRDGRLPPPPHPPQLQDEAAGCAALLAMLGSAAIEGPVISWVADHRKHHAFSDQEGDPHSPHVDHGGGLRGALRGPRATRTSAGCSSTPSAAHASATRRDLIAGPARSAFVDRTFLLWVLGGLARRVRARLRDRRHPRRRAHRPAVGRRACGCSSCTTSPTASTRCATSSAARRFDDRRRVAQPRSGWRRSTFGEAWHNNHHAFPTSAAHGLRRWEIDPSGLVIRGLERLGLVWDVVRIEPERQASKAIA